MTPQNRERWCRDDCIHVDRSRYEALWNHEGPAAARAVCLIAGTSRRLVPAERRVYADLPNLRRERVVPGIAVRFQTDRQTDKQTNENENIISFFGEYTQNNKSKIH